jgi:cholesterol transport system auxiliary component
VSQFMSRGFVYRTSELSFLIDYYNIFFTSPAQQINKLIIDYLRDKNIFSYVANDAGQLKINYILYPQITALYADYRNPKRPLGVIAIDCTLFSANKISWPLLHKQYLAQIPLAAKNSESLVKAWNEGLQNILFDFSNDLMQI